MSESLKKLHELGQSIWYDNIERGLLESGEFESMVTAGDIRGVTSNPSIFQKAIGGSGEYDDDLAALAAQGKTAEQIYESLAIDDIQAAADILLPLYEASGGGDGFVSLEVSPELAHDTEGTCRDARRLWDAVDRPNLMIKIPATEAGLSAIRQTIAAGVNVNITLIFSRARYHEVMDAFLAGLEDRLKDNLPIGGIASVASFFVSRIDSKVDGWLEEIVRSEDDGAQAARALMGQLAIANARLAYQAFKDVFSGERYQKLREHGAQLQRPLWASTSTKNPAYSDVLYVETLIGPDTVNTVPPATLEAFKDHGQAALTIENQLEQARTAFERFEALGLDFEKATAELEAEGVEAFARSYADLLETVEERRTS